MRHEEAVARDADRQRHIVLLADDEALHDEVEEVLLIFRMKHDHPAVQEIGNFDIIGLDRQGRIDHPTRKHGHGRQTMAGP